MTERQLQIAVGLPVLLGALDLTVISAVLPAVVSELALPVPSGVRQASWLVTGYLVAYAIGIVMAGRLSDRIGAARLLRGAIVVFGLASVFVAVSGPWSTRLVQQVAYRTIEARPSPEFVALWLLVGGRALQAAAAGALVPAGMSYGWKELGTQRWLGFVAAVDLAGWTLGHLYGGIIVRVSEWRLAFWINVPFVVLSLVMLRGAESSRSHDRPMPWLRVMLFGAGLGLSMVAIGGAEGAGGGVRPGWLVAGIVAVSLSLLGDVDALMPFGRLLRRPGVLVANLALGGSVFLVLAFVPLFVAVLIEPDPEQAGWVAGWFLSLFTIPMAVVAWVSVRWPNNALRLVASAGGIFGFLLITRWEADYQGMAGALLVLGLSFGVWFGPLAERVLVRVELAESGAASAAVILARLVGMAMGTAALTNTVLSNVAAVTTASALADDLLNVFQNAAYLGVAVSAVLAISGMVVLWRPAVSSSL